MHMIGPHIKLGPKTAFDWMSARVGPNTVFVSVRFCSILQVGEKTHKMATDSQQELPDFTNMYWNDFGKADSNQKAIFDSMDPNQKKERKEWLEKMHGTKMPCGPYPFHLRDYGWCQAMLPKDGPVFARYCKRGDLNLDVNFFTDGDGTPGAKRKMVSQKTKVQNVQLFQEMYDAEASSFISKPIGPISLSGK